MKFGLMYASIGPFSQPDSLARLARLADDAGIESMWSIEHVVLVPAAMSLLMSSE